MWDCCTQLQLNIKSHKHMCLSRRPTRKDNRMLFKFMAPVDDPTAQFPVSI